MITNINNSIQFTGSRQVLRDADWVCRKVKTAFPMISPTKVYFSNPELINNNKRFVSFIFDKSVQIQKDRADRHFLRSPFKFLTEVLYSASRNKAGNCSEFVSLAEMIAKINGVKNCYRVSMVDPSGKTKLDHTALLVTKNATRHDGIDSKDSIIIDPWLGISGRAGEIVNRYKNEFGKILKLKEDTPLELKITNSLDLKDFELDMLKSQFPELICQKREKSAGFMKFA